MSAMPALLSALCMLLCAAVATAQPNAAGISEYVYDIPVGAPLESLPGAGELSPPKNRRVKSVSLRIVPVTYRMSTPAGEVLVFTAPGYLSAKPGSKPLMFGPTMKLRSGDALSISLANELVDNGTDPDPNAFGYHRPMDTNLHTHGVHDEPGPYSQANAADYTGGDNIFVNVPARRSPADAPARISFTSNIRSDHLPGLHWYHPHKDGSTIFQVSTSHGAILIEDNQWWMPWNRGSCGNVWTALQGAPDFVMDVTMLFFRLAPQGPAQYAADPNYQWVSGDGVQNATTFAWNTTLPPNPLCCDSNRTGYAFRGSATQGNGTDLIFLNGAYQPRITMHDGSWVRWRFLMSSAKGWLVLQLLEKDGADGSLAFSDRCEMMMIAKDGVYLMNLPRKVPALLLASGNRVEVLARCSAPPPGKSLVLSATNKPDAFNPSNTDDFATIAYHAVQDVVATIRVVPLSGKAKPGFPLENEGCTPRRPSYVRDIRDAALAAAKYSSAGIVRTVVNINDKPPIEGVGCRFNNKTFFIPDPEPFVMPLGKIVEWHYNLVRFHPLHIHVNPHQVVWFNRSSQIPGTLLEPFFKEGDWSDTLLVPQLGLGNNPDAVRIRFQPGPYSGYGVVHCHFLQHEDVGCMKMVRWQCPGYGEVQPVNNRCPGFKFPVPGDIS